MKTVKYLPRAIHGVPFLHCLLLLLFLSPPLFQLAAAQRPSSSNDDDYNRNVNPSLAVIVIVLVLVFFITGCISIYIHQCSDSSTVSAAPTAVSRRGAARGLEQSVIETFPTFLYSEVKELKIGKGSLECAVCLNEFEEEDDETLRLLPKCDHVFHSQCIDAWLAGHSTCPVCRADLLQNPSQIGKTTESTHEEIGSHGEEELPSGERIPSCEVQIAIPECENRGPKMSGKFPRSHSTGHSLSPLGEDSERFTLKLPAEVRRQLLARTKLKRATSLLPLHRASSSRRGYRGGGGEGSGSSRYSGILGRSISRVVSFKWTPRARAGGEVAEAAGYSKRISGTAVTPSSEARPYIPV